MHKSPLQFLFNYLAVLQFNVHVFTSRVVDSMDPDQLAIQKPTEMDLHCFPNRKNLGLV